MFITECLGSLDLKTKEKVSKTGSNVTARKKKVMFMIDSAIVLR